MMKKPKIGILYGEAAGVGPEIVAKALNKPDINDLATWILIGDERIFLRGSKIVGQEIKYKKISDINEVNSEESTLWLLDTQNTNPEDTTLGVLSQQSGKSSGDNLKVAAKLAKAKQIDGITYSSFNKDALFKGGYKFMDDIHLLADFFDLKSGFGEVNVVDNLWFTRVTSHIPVKNVAKNITKDNVLKSIYFSNKILVDAGFKNPKIGLTALNPHASDGGLIGDEEFAEIIPAVEQAQKEKLNVVGPYPADTIFLRLEDESIDCLLSMYHDQAQIGLKLMGFDRGVTISGGLPVPITTAAHGSAFDIAGSGRAGSGGFEQAIKMCLKMID